MLFRSEVNVREVQYIEDTASVVVKKVRPNFKALGPRYGKLMKEISSAVSAFTQMEIASFESTGSHQLVINGQQVSLTADDMEIISEDIPGWQVANDGKLTVALDVTVTEDLRYEGIAREFVNRIQNIRKDNGFDVTDKITVLIEDHSLVREAVIRHSAYIGSQTLATNVLVVNDFTDQNVREIEIDEVTLKIVVSRNN